MSLIADVLDQTGNIGLTGLEQLRALMASGRRPGNVGAGTSQEVRAG